MENEKSFRNRVTTEMLVEYVVGEYAPPKTPDSLAIWMLFISLVYGVIPFIHFFVLTTSFPAAVIGTIIVFAVFFASIAILLWARSARRRKLYISGHANAVQMARFLLTAPPEENNKKYEKTLRDMIEQLNRLAEKKPYQSSWFIVVE